MKILDIVRVVVYRFQEKGLEVFLVNAEMYNENIWKIPSVELNQLKICEDCIELDPFVDIEGSIHYTVAIPSSTTSIPRVSIGHERKEHLPELEEGTFFSVKEAIKCALPNECSVLHELKDVLFDRNLIRYI